MHVLSGKRIILIVAAVHQISLNIRKLLAIFSVFRAKQPKCSLKRPKIKNYRFIKLEYARSNWQECWKVCCTKAVVPEDAGCFLVSDGETKTCILSQRICDTKSLPELLASQMNKPRWDIKRELAGKRGLTNLEAFLVNHSVERMR